MADSQDYWDYVRREIEYKRLRDKYGHFEGAPSFHNKIIRITVSWLERCPTPMLRELAKMWSLQYSLYDSWNAHKRAERASQVLKRREQ